MRGGTIKTAGTHQVEINFYREIGAVVTLLVADPDAEEEVVEAEETAEVEETAEAAETEESAE